MRLVVLDIDGVLATPGTYNLWKKDHGGTMANLNPNVDNVLLDRACVRRVQFLCDTIGAKILISSSWRLFYTLDELSTMLKIAGLSTEIVGATPDMPGKNRGREILPAIQELKVSDKDIVILEDEEDITPLRHRQVRTTFGGSNAGFQDKHLRNALKLFGVEWNSSTQSVS